MIYHKEGRASAPQHCLAYKKLEIHSASMVVIALYSNVHLYGYTDLGESSTAGWSMDRASPCGEHAWKHQSNAIFWQSSPVDRLSRQCWGTMCQWAEHRRHVLRETFHTCALRQTTFDGGYIITYHRNAQNSGLRSGSSQLHMDI